MSGDANFGQVNSASWLVTQDSVSPAQITTLTTTDVVNTGRIRAFEWTVPAAHGDGIQIMAIRKMSAAGAFLYDYQLNCSQLTDLNTYPACPVATAPRREPLCFDQASMSCTPGETVRVELGSDLFSEQPWYLTPTETYTWKAIAQNSFNLYCRWGPDGGGVDCDGETQGQFSPVTTATQ
eukprot:7379615-Prymnesium_polylepis.1